MLGSMDKQEQHSWKNLKWTSGQILNIVGRSLSQWNDSKHIKVQSVTTASHSNKQPARWEKSVDGRNELNVDAALFSSRGLAGFGCVLRGANGDFISARAVSVCLWLQACNLTRQMQ